MHWELQLKFIPATFVLCTHTKLNKHKDFLHFPTVKLVKSLPTSRQEENTCKSKN